MPQIGDARLQISDGFVNIGFDFDLIGFCICTFEKPKLLLLQVAIDF